MVDSAYALDLAEDAMLPDTPAKFIWENYFSNVVMAAQASTAVSVPADSLTEANHGLVMTVDETGSSIAAGTYLPQLIINDRRYDSAIDTVSQVGRWLVGCFPVEGINGTGYGVGLNGSTLQRTGTAKDAIGMLCAGMVATPSALSALTYLTKGVPQESLLLEKVDGYAKCGIGLTLANLGETPDKWIGVASYTVNDAGTECTVAFSRAYAHPPVVALGEGDTRVTVADVSTTEVRLYIHSPITERRVLRTITAIGFIA